MFYHFKFYFANFATFLLAKEIALFFKFSSNVNTRIPKRLINTAHSAFFCSRLLATLYVLYFGRESWSILVSEELRYVSEINSS